MGYGLDHLIKLAQQVDKKRAQTMRSAKALSVASKYPSRLVDYFVSKIHLAGTQRVYQKIDAFHFNQFKLARRRERHFDRRLSEMPDDPQRAYERAQRDYSRDPAVVASWLQLHLIMVWNWTFRNSKKAWVWLGVHKPIKFLDLTWRIAIFSVGTLALVSLGIAGLINVTLIESSKDHGALRADNTDHVAPPSEDIIDLEPTQDLQPLRRERSTFTPVFPVDRVPMIWQWGETTKLFRGFDRIGTSVQDISYSPAVCSAHTIVFFGTASLDGSLIKNQKLARDRATILKERILRGCPNEEVRTSIAVALSDPLASNADGLQRKAFALMSAQEEPTEDIYAVLLTASTAIDQAIGDSVEQFDTIEVCVSHPPQSSCRWQMLEQSITPGSTQNMEIANSQSE
jgi:hypothetical protein